MSGGYIKPQKHGDHQMVVFTFAGELKGTHAKKWNDAVLNLKRHFGTSVMGVTMKGHSTPPNLMVPKKKKKK
jgi:hypothetical protein